MKPQAPKTKPPLWPIPLAVLSAICILYFINHPLRWPRPLLTGYILRLTPLGSDFMTIKQLVNAKGWKIRHLSETSGFYDQRRRPSKITGAMHIRAELGHYQNLPFETYVTVYWGFDDQGKLTDVWVWKTWDSL